MTPNRQPCLELSHWHRNLERTCILFFVGKCVQKSVCPHWNCLANETYQQCGNYCMEPTCFVPDTTGRVCDTACVPRCQCDEGFVRDQHGNCVALGQCPSLYCADNEVYTNNYNPCNENSCTATFGCVAPTVIQSGCMCKEGFVRDRVSGKFLCFECSQLVITELSWWSFQLKLRTS